MDTARDDAQPLSRESVSRDEQHYLPKEPLDLPREPLDLPQPHESLPVEHTQHPHQVHEHEHTHQHHAQEATTQHTNDYSHAEEDVPYTIKTLLSWAAPGRPYRQRGKEYFASIFLITLLIEIIVFLFGDYILMLVVLSLSFLTIVLALVPPHDYHYRISSEGITIEDHFFLWQELYDFYFKRRETQDILHIRTKAYIPGELTITLGDIHKDQIKNILIHYLPFREVVQQTIMEKSGNWLSTTFPLEKQN